MPDSEIRDRVVQLYQDGVRLSKITEQTGVPQPTIYFLLQQAGVEPSRTGTRRARPAERDEMAASLAWAMDRISALEAELQEVREQWAVHSQSCGRPNAQ